MPRLPTSIALSAWLETRIMRAWQRRGVVAWLMSPIALGFAAVTALRRQAYLRGWLEVERLAVPVLIVGNVTVGGTGKTPTVIALIEALRGEGYTPGVISRGYGARADLKCNNAAIRAAGKTANQIAAQAKITEKILAVTPNTCAHGAGDEPLLIARRTGAPVFVGRDRAATARALLAAHPQVDLIISDDGLQHYRLARDVELVVFDDRLGGNGFLLPAGPLRESLARRRDATLINNPYSSYLPLWPDTYSLPITTGAAWQLDNPAVTKSLAQFTGRRILAAAGIGAPERFFASLRAAGLTITTLALPDHYDFIASPFHACDADIILITEKDAVKCTWTDTRIWVVPAYAMLDAKLIKLIAAKLRQATCARIK